MDMSSTLFIVYSSDAEAGSNQFWPQFRPVSTNWGLNRLRAVAELKPRSLRGRLWASGVETKISCSFVSRLAVSRTMATLGRRGGVCCDATRHVMSVVARRCTEQAKTRGCILYLENNKERRIIQSTQVGGDDTPEYNRRSVGSVESRRQREGHVEL